MKRATPYLMFPGNPFGSCIDRFGVRWMVDYEGTVDFGMP